MCKETGANISEKFIDRAHRLGNSYAYNKKKQVSRKKSCKKIIMRFTTFCYRTMVDRAKKNMKNNVLVQLNLPEKRYNLIISANKLIQNIESIKFCYIDVNCRAKIKFSDDSVDDDFFHSLDELKSMVAILL